MTAGTIGAIVFNRTTCKPMILSNWHVLAGASAAAVGEGILQPGRVDGGTQVVATLTQMRLDSQMDAAVATLNGVRSNTRDILGLGTVAGIDTATLGMLVVKSGRTTGITRGVVDGVSMSVSINYGDPGVVSFANQFRIVPRPPWPSVDYEVSQGGDSGSVWLNEANNRAIGLHFAGETNPAPASENAICNPIGAIAAAFNFSFLPVLCKRPDFPVFPWVDICRRFPWICERMRYPIPPFPPFPGPWPYTRPFDDFRNPGGGSGGFRRQGSGSEGGCGCGGGGSENEAMEFMAAMFAAMMEEHG